jgi:hypothetical protein
MKMNSREETDFALFSSDHCLPLSPKNEEQAGENDKDLIFKILETLNPLKEDDYCFVTNEDAK